MMIGIFIGVALYLDACSYKVPCILLNNLLSNPFFRAFLSIESPV
jgi:hypothetical protein